tara:strand:- start:1124 stop:1861 length:738 start_codon:yes stop_codon:yes gene_type:complete
MKAFMKEIVLPVFIAVVLALGFRSIAFEPFNIPSGSMKPTLLIGDYVFVSKYSYGYSRYSFPFGLGLFEGRIFDSKPERGDVVVFRNPKQTSINYIKRVIGLPGDTVQMRSGVLYLNGQEISKRRISNFKDRDADGNVTEIPQFIETLPNNVSYLVLDQSDTRLDDTKIYRVPNGHYFMMGDNRDNSQDSRVVKMVGFVPEEMLLGPARIVAFSSTSSLLKPWDYRLSRFFDSIAFEEENVGEAG